MAEQSSDVHLLLRLKRPTSRMYARQQHSKWLVDFDQMPQYEPRETRARLCELQVVLLLYSFQYPPTYAFQHMILFIEYLAVCAVPNDRFPRSRTFDHF